MDSAPFSEILPAVIEPVGIAGLGALAIWAGVRLAQTVIAALRDVEMARIAVQGTMAQALQAQAQAAGSLAEGQAEVRRMAAEHTITLRLIAQRIGMGWQQEGDEVRE